MNTKINLDTVLERDIDLLIIEEFLSSTEFAGIFLQEVSIEKFDSIEKIYHSKRDSDYGESDIVIVLIVNGKRHAIHIEDKIDAPAMPEQHERYYKRIQKDISEKEYDTASLILAAPQKYIDSNSEAKKYRYRVTYEQLRDYFSQFPDSRARYKYTLITQAIEGQKKSYQLKIKPGVEDFCRKMNEYQTKKYPSLPLGTMAYWPHRKIINEGVSLVYKPNFGLCDLSFSGKSAKELYGEVAELLSSRMFIEQTGKAAAVRIRVQTASIEDEKFEDSLNKVDEALEALQELYELSMKILDCDKLEQH